LFVFKISDGFSRLWLIFWTCASATMLSGMRLVSGFTANKLMLTGVLTKNFVIVGASELGQRLARRLDDESAGMLLLGLFDQRNRVRVARGAGADIPVQEFPALYGLLSRGLVDEVIITIPPHARDRIMELSALFHPFPVSLCVLAPEGFEHLRILDNCRYGDVNTLRVMNKPMDEVAVIIKWVEDKVIAFCCLLLVLPLMLLATLAIKLDSRGPVFFKQKRVGANNRSFELLKFRSMYVEQADPLGSQLTRASDPRITRVGRFLRRTSVDELPQLINVLRGDMSLVGPRPHPLAANAAGVEYARAVDKYLIRHRVKPGITGWAQVNGWRGETVTIEQIRQRVDHDLYYVDNWSLAFDLLILVRTVFTVASQRNAI
jgi:Undecaprenyl-phosphate glucose phosphotransferase